MPQSQSVKTGDRIKLSGGYSFEPEWLAGKQSVSGAVIAFLPGQNDTLAAVIKLDTPMTFEDVTGDVLVLELRYVGAEWSPVGVVHVELCDFMPEAKPWQERKKGKWAESHASYERIAT